MPAAPRIVKPRGFHHRVLLVGPSGVGKTPLAASFPRPVFFDTEGGIEPYRAQFDLAEFDLADADSYYDALIATIQSMKSDTQGYQTLVVDSISTIYNRLIEQYVNRRGEMTYQTRSYVKLKMKLLHIELMTLPMNLVATAWHEDFYTSKDRQLSKAGDKADADMKIQHAFHFVFLMQKNKPVEIWKLRGVQNPPATIERLTFNWMDGVAKKWASMGSGKQAMWTIADISAELASLFNAPQHLENTCKKLQEDGSLSPEMTVVEVVNVVRDYVERKHPDRIAWHKDPQQVSNLDEGLRDSFATTLEKFLTRTGTTLEDYESANDIYQRAEDLMTEGA